MRGSLRIFTEVSHFFAPVLGRFSLNIIFSSRHLPRSLPPAVLTLVTDLVTDLNSLNVTSLM